LRYNRSRFFIFIFFLQQLSGKSIVNLYKSSSAFHQESNKIEVAFFLIFLQFSMHFTSFSQTSTLFKKLICKEVPRGFDSLQKHPRFAAWPSEIFVALQCGPRGEGPTRLAGIRRARPCSRPGRDGERVPAPQGFDFGARPGQGEGR
jgi:hypothetical protein